jgi:hypothetical protein
MALFSLNTLISLGAKPSPTLASRPCLSINREFSWIVRPSITTVEMLVYEMGKIAAQILLESVRNGRCENEDVKVQGE